MESTNTEKMYCVKCRAHVIVTGPKKVRTKSNRDALQGNCPHCHTVTYRFVSSK
jgi:RNase P subunit RPR2